MQRSVTNAIELATPKKKLRAFEVGDEVYVGSYGGYWGEVTEIVPALSMPKSFRPRRNVLLRPHDSYIVSRASCHSVRRYKPTTLQWPDVDRLYHDDPHESDSRQSAAPPVKRRARIAIQILIETEEA